ncbi:MAG: hypothetical protein RBU37_23225 [Myxococcota bacterium]|jgi:hypothetical protein|nr:hypothetical protein [Myxococcota bacterium]
MKTPAFLSLVLMSFCACGEDAPELTGFTRCTQACPAYCGSSWSCSPDGKCLCAFGPDQTDAPDAPDAELGPDILISPSYRFVRIDDVTPAPTGENKGADLDAVVLTKFSGTQFFAANVELYLIGGGDPIAIDHTQILGAPDAFVDWGVGDLSICDGNHGFVALGQGGSIVVRMDGEIEAGDILTVLELSRCGLLSGAGVASDDSVEVYVSVAADIAGTWTPVGGGIGPEISMIIPQLPVPQP